VVAVTFAAEIGDVRRFDNPRQLMSFLGLVPAESSTGERVRRKGLTLAGNRRARRVLVEAAWTPAFASAGSIVILPGRRDPPSPARRVAQSRARHCLERASPPVRPLSPTEPGQAKKLPVVVAAIARETAAFLRAIGREVAPA
jgi:hypothetical protein